MGNIVCEGCKRLILDSQSKCPICGTPTSKIGSLIEWSSNLIKDLFKLAAALFLIVILVVGGFFLWSVYDRLGNQQAAYRECTEAMASEVAKEFIRVRLGQKSGPIFSGAGGNIPRAKKESGCRFMAYGKVSAIVGGENMKAGYIVQVFREETQDGNIWRLKDITFTAP